MAPSAAQAKTVHSQWNASDKDAFIFALYQQMFASHPEWRAKFGRFSGDPNPGDGAWKKQFDVTRDALQKAIELADGDMGGLKSALHDLAKKHVAHGVGQGEFQKLKPILAQVASSKVGGCDAGAWQAVGDYVCDNLA